MATEYLPKYSVPHPDIKFPIVKPKKDSNLKMKAVVIRGNMDTRVEDVPKPMITESGDAIIRISSAAICGSDLHLYHKEFQGLPSGYILGHEGMGYVESIGSEVKDFKVGDRVVISAVIICGKCFYCEREEYSLCENTNPNKEIEGMYGHRLAGIFGYSELLGGYEGMHAEYVRVPIADLNLLKVPQGIPDEKLVGLSDTFCTGLHATELGEVKQGDTVAIWGLGPIGLMTATWSKFKGAARVIGIDAVPERLELARSKLGVETIDFSKVDPVKAIQEMCSPLGPDVCIDCCGFRYDKTLLHKFQRAVRLETDDPLVLKECFTAVRKGGHVSIVGDYYAYSNQYPIGAMMEKGLTVRGSQVYLQKYWKFVLDQIVAGKFDPTFLWTHKLPMEKADEGYRIFDQKRDGVIKIILKTGIPA